MRAVWDGLFHFLENILCVLHNYTLRLPYNRVIIDDHANELRPALLSMSKSIEAGYKSGDDPSADINGENTHQPATDSRMLIDSIGPVDPPTSLTLQTHHEQYLERKLN